MNDQNVRKAAMAAKAFKANHASHNQKAHGRRGGVGGGGGKPPAMSHGSSSEFGKYKVSLRDVKVRKTIGTSNYENTHGKKPKGNGAWAFHVSGPKGKSEKLFAMGGAQNFTTAKKQITKRAQEWGAAQGHKDVTVIVAS